MPDKIAVIDIGSNSIRYMEAERVQHGFGFSSKQVYTTRLAEGQTTSGALSEARMTASLKVLSDLREQAGAQGLPCRCYATSAVREASNQAAFLRRIREIGLSDVEVLTGREEAAFAYRGATGGLGGLIDIGGGSTQIVTRGYAESFPLGCVRVRDLCGQQPLAGMQISMLPRFDALYGLPPLPKAPWTAVGGTATTLAALSLGLTVYDSEAVGRMSFDAPALDALLGTLDRMGPEGRAAHPLLIKRHDVILCGGLILRYLMERIGIRVIRISDADGMEGYAMHLLSEA